MREVLVLNLIERAVIALESIAESLKIKKQRKIKRKEIKPSKEVQDVIEHLNKRTRRSFRNNNIATIKLIESRLKEGYSVDQCKKVVDNQTRLWLNDTVMAKYLRPSTLFAPSHFEEYLNQPTERTKEELEAYLNASTSG